MILKQILITTALLALAGRAPADAFADLQTLTSHLESAQASFTQSFTPKGFQSVQKESGTVVFGTLPQMRWSYSQPGEKVFVFDGDTSWFYIPAEKQVTIHSVSAEERASLPFVLLGDRAKLESAYSVTSKGTAGADLVIVLKAKAASAPISVIQLTTGAGGRVVRLSYVDQGGNSTLFDFSNWTPIVPKASTFHFETPDGTQTVRN